MGSNSPLDLSDNKTDCLTVMHGSFKRLRSLNKLIVRDVQVHLKKQILLFSPF